MQAEITNAVRHVYGRTDLHVTSYQLQSPGYRRGNPGTAGLYRVAGTARADDGQESPFSLVMKVVRPRQDAPDNPTHWNYWKREGLAYQSGLLAHLPAGLAAPRFGGAFAEAGGGLAYLMEEVADEAPAAWSMAQYATHAGRLARLNLVRPQENHPWLLQQGWLPSALPVGRWFLAQADEGKLWEQEHMHVFAPAILRAVRHIAGREGLMMLQMLNSLPKGLCHFDAHRDNALTRGGETVLLDWNFLGWGALGEDIGHLFGISLIDERVEVMNAPEFQEALLGGYLQGLREAGWQGDEQAVRAGFVIGAVLRGLAFALPLRAGWLAADPAREVHAEAAGEAVRFLLSLLADLPE